MQSSSTSCPMRFQKMPIRDGGAVDNLLIEDRLWLGHQARGCCCPPKCGGGLGSTATPECSLDIYVGGDDGLYLWGGYRLGMNLPGYPSMDSLIGFFRSLSCEDARWPSRCSRPTTMPEAIC